MQMPKWLKPLSAIMSQYCFCRMQIALSFDYELFVFRFFSSFVNEAEIAQKLYGTNGTYVFRFQKRTNALKTEILKYTRFSLTVIF